MAHPDDRISHSLGLLTAPLMRDGYRPEVSRGAPAFADQAIPWAKGFEDWLEKQRNGFR